MFDRSKKRILAILFGTLLLIPIALIAIAIEKRPETSPVSRGERLAIESGCFACHGHSEEEPIVNFRQSSSGKWRGKSNATFWENGMPEADIVVEWIRDGVTKEQAERHKRLFMRMPAYGDNQLDGEEIDAIAAWIMAKGLHLSGGMGNSDIPIETPTEESVSEMDATRLFVLGDRLSRQQGCYQCHGELGQGGVSNLSSFKGYIPGFFGSDFRELTQDGDREELLHWIDHGRGIAVESGILGGLAKGYRERQAIDMPAYENSLSEYEKNILIDFMLALNDKGPMQLADIEAAAQLLSESASKH